MSLFVNKSNVDIVSLRSWPSALYCPPSKSCSPSRLIEQPHPPSISLLSSLTISVRLTLTILCCSPFACSIYITLMPRQRRSKPPHETRRESKKKENKRLNRRPPTPPPSSATMFTNIAPLNTRQRFVTLGVLLSILLAMIFNEPIDSFATLDYIVS